MSAPDKGDLGDPEAWIRANTRCYQIILEYLYDSGRERLSLRTVLSGLLQKKTFCTYAQWCVIFAADALPLPCSKPNAG